MNIRGIMRSLRLLPHLLPAHALGESGSPLH